ncbi:DUF4928 family protein [Escherichia coli]
MTSLKTSIKTITYLSDIGCLEIQGASLIAIQAAETFIGNNIEEIAIYDGDKIRESLARLIHLL